MDKEQWTLHARANAREDLQAWYHHTFSDELYRLPGSLLVARGGLAGL